MEWHKSQQLDDLRAFIFSEHQKGKINDDTAKELVRIVDELINQ